jgi:putative salt-induced outer membrane protein YdiY
MPTRDALCITLFLLLPFPVLAADQVVLTNGDTITGAIVKKDGGKLTIKSEFLGEVTMPWSAVKSIRSDAELNVVLPSGETVKGKIASVGDQLQIAGGPQSKTAPLAGVAAVRDAAEQHHFERLLHPRLLELWNGNFDIGLALARGNARSDSLTTAFTAGRDTRNDKITLNFIQIHSTARVNNLNSTIASAVRGGWKYNRNVSSRMFLTGFNDYEHDRFQNLSLRFVAGGGAGVKAVKLEHTQLDFDAGIDYQRENFMSGLNRNSAEFNFGDNLFYQVSKGTSVTQSMRVFANLSDAGAYRVNFDLGSSTVLKKWLGWHVTASDRFLSNPVQGRQRNDLLISTGFRLTFAK